MVQLRRRRATDTEQESAPAHPPATSTEQIKELEERIEALEERLEALERPFTALTPRRLPG